jgi:predicted nucleic acid-binding protein
MKPALIDTNILSFFFRNHSLVVERFESYLKVNSQINISIITYYEIVSGLKPAFHTLNVRNVGSKSPSFSCNVARGSLKY